MQWSDVIRPPSARTLRQFAAAWLVFFLVWAAVLGLARGRAATGWTLAAVGLAVGAPGLAWPQAIRWLFVGAMVAAFPIGWAVSHLMLGLLFYGIFTPMALLLRLRGRDALHLKRPQAATYWLPKETPADVRRYFKQY
jgi:hypothetical protein